MRGMLRTTAAIAGAILTAATMAGCMGAAEKTIDYTQTSVTLAPGEALVVDMGEVNASVGTDWVITQEPDPAVLSAGESHSRYLGEDGSVGGPNELTYRFAPVGTGTTVIAFEYRFRGAVPEDPDDRKTAEIAVTVE